MVINKSEQNQKEKYIIDKDITKDIIIEEFDESLDIPIKIIYDNHIFILTTNSQKAGKKLHLNVFYGEGLKIKLQITLIFIVRQ